MDKSLATLLRALQSGSDEQDVSRLLGSATTLLTLLSNPLNVTLITSQLLSAPAIWQRPDGLRTTIRILGIFNSAAIHFVQSEDSPETNRQFPTQRGLGREDWVIAVVKGADARSPRWRHLCVLAGLLIGFEGRGKQSISQSLRSNLESATVKAVNLALQEEASSGELVGDSVGMMLSHVFDLLSDSEKMNINNDLLLPTLTDAAFYSEEGLQNGDFLSTIDSDVVQREGMKFDWSPKSSTYMQCQRMTTGPLIASLGSLSRLTAFCVENVSDAYLLSGMIDELRAFTRSLCEQWRQNKLSEIDITEESMYLSEESLRATTPLLWRVLKSTMFAVVIILRSLLGRVLSDNHMRADGGPFMAIQTLHILGDLYFVSSRLGANAFSQYTFVFLTAIDILSQFPVQAEAFLRAIRPPSAGSIPQHPLDRCLDLYFLNTAEHFTTVLSPELNEELLIGAATPYLGLGSDQRLFEIFESAHSVMLAVLSASQNSDLLAKHIHPYVDVLFRVFPHNLSARQFRIAVKTLIRISSPPSLISERQPLLPSTILELVRFRLEIASPALMQRNAGPPAPSFPEEKLPFIGQPSFSEQSVLALTLIDALPFLPIDQLEDWLPIVAESVNMIKDADQLRTCRQRFWNVLSNGEMDVGRAALCVAWWGTRGGRDMVLFGRDNQAEGPLMSGALEEASKL
ncbi:hypothetical protein HO173_007284 [Letharia columbiana]|uniref:Peroxisomal membrane protein PEX17 n=1 Tax=Letharia columbiana TaxID=112416 RepID=A0A8H6L3X7_9LECA|nr:uncharacterized protein HO173_007284 [Letharia columbiana]KAF6234658.1 hypothetical protein HO173_007284 [Letharia columbiana]